MPRPIEITGIDGLPLWDTFEVSYFFVAGIATGVVLGFLFPSIWRHFRRNFRNSQKYAPRAKDKLLNTTYLFKEDHSNNEIDKLFVQANFYKLEKSYIEAINIYMQIISHENVSKNSTNHCLYELAETYLLISLFDRAFDTSFELFHRKPKQYEILKLVINIIKQGLLFDNIDKVIKVWQGKNDNYQKQEFANLYATYAEYLFKQQKYVESKKFAKKALFWQVENAYALLILWQIRGYAIWQQNDIAFDEKCDLFFAECETRFKIYNDTNISPAAFADYFAQIILTLNIEYITHKNVLYIHDIQQENFFNEQIFEHFLYAIMVIYKSNTLEIYTNLVNSLFILLPPFKKFYKMYIFNTHSLFLMSKFIFICKCENCLYISTNFIWECPNCNSFGSFHSL